MVNKYYQKKKKSFKKEEAKDIKTLLTKKNNLDKKGLRGHKNLSGEEREKKRQYHWDQNI